MFHPNIFVAGTATTVGAASRSTCSTTAHSTRASHSEAIVMPAPAPVPPPKNGRSITIVILSIFGGGNWLLVLGSRLLQGDTCERAPTMQPHEQRCCVVRLMAPERARHARARAHWPTPPRAPRLSFLPGFPPVRRPILLSSRRMLLLEQNSIHTRVSNRQAPAPRV